MDTDNIKHESFFATPIYSEYKPEWLNELNNACEPYLQESKDNKKEYLDKHDNDFGIIYHSKSILHEPKIKFLVDYIGKKSWNLLEQWGVNLENHSLAYSSFWVQEFAKDGGGHHRVHIHENSHVSGFYFLENDNSSYPLFHDPRHGAAMTYLPEKNENKVTFSNKYINYQPLTGTLMLFPSYLPHEYVLSKGGKFKFIHINLQAVSNNVLNNEGSR